MIALKPDLFNGYATLGKTLHIMDGDFAETEKQTRKSIELNPDYSNWSYSDLGVSLIDMRRVYEAIELLEKSIETHDEFGKTHRLASLVDGYGRIGKFGQAERCARQAAAENVLPYSHTLALFNLGKIRVRQNRLPEAIALFEHSLAADPTPNALFILDRAWLGEVARLQGKAMEAESMFQKALTYSSGSVWEDMAAKDEAHYLYGNFLLRQNRLTEANEQFQKSLDMRWKGFWGEYGFALLAARQGKTREALDWLERSLDNYFPEAKPILEEPLLKKLRKTTRFKALIKKHFPDNVKD